MLYFLDTSALVKRYHPEPGSVVVQELFDDAANLIVISVLTFAETLVVLDRIAKQAGMTRAEFHEAIGGFYVDYRQQRFAAIEVLERHLQDCHRLIFEFHLTAADALILAAALTTRAQHPTFVCADARSGFLQAAEACGLSTLNPLSPPR